jgi:predicted acyltransferase
MTKDRFKKLMNNYYFQLFWVIIIALILIMISIVLVEDIDMDNRIFRFNLFGTLALIGFLYSYSLTKKNIRNDLSVGMTRKETYLSYLKNVFIALFVAQFFVIYYMVIYKIVINLTILC